PLRCDVEVIERQADGIHHSMARSASGIRAMYLHPLTRRQHLAAFGFFSLLQVRYVWWRWRWWRAEKYFHHPLSSKHRRGTVRKGREDQYAALAEQASPLVVRIFHAAKMRSSDVGNSIVLREALVGERVVGGEKLEDASVLTNEVVEEQLGLASHRISEILV